MSFPRKRESMLTLNGQMDSRFRGNDGVVSGQELASGQTLKIHRP